VCKNNKCRAEAAIIIKGTKKWIAKNRFKVALSTANPPHSHCTSEFPIYGMAENKFVITVAPQNLICPQIKTYPRNADIITKIKIITPIFHVSIYKYEP
jgi:hypothetical protein